MSSTLSCHVYWLLTHCLLIDMMFLLFSNNATKSDIINGHRKLMKASDRSYNHESNKTTQMMQLTCQYMYLDNNSFIKTIESVYYLYLQDDCITMYTMHLKKRISEVLNYCLFNSVASRKESTTCHEHKTSVFSKKPQLRVMQLHRTIL